MSGQLTMYTTSWCGFCRNLKKQLARAGIEITEVDIEQDQAAAEFVMSVNGGNQTVPTVVFPDGTALVNPSAAQVRERFAAVSAGTLGTDRTGPVVRAAGQDGHERVTTRREGEDVATARVSGDQVVCAGRGQGWQVGAEQTADLTSAMVLADLLAADLGIAGPAAAPPGRAGQGRPGDEADEAGRGSR